MPRSLLILASFTAFHLSWAAGDAVRQAPSYSASGIVNSATGLPNAIAPNSFVTLYGTGLSNATRSIGPEDVRAGILPTVLGGTGVRVLVGGFPAYIFFVSPTQVNFLVPSNLIPGPTEFQLVLDGRAGPAIKVTLSETAPGLYPMDEESIIAAHADGEPTTADNPARPGEVIVLYANGLGPTTPSVINGQVPTKAARIKYASLLHLSLNGEPVDPSNILYAGITPYSAGMYQINLKVPDGTPDDPEVRIQLPGSESPAGTRIRIRRAE